MQPYFTICFCSLFRHLVISQKIVHLSRWFAMDSPSFYQRQVSAAERRERGAKERKLPNPRLETGSLEPPRALTRSLVPSPSALCICTGLTDSNLEPCNFGKVGHLAAIRQHIIGQKSHIVSDRLSAAAGVKQFRGTKSAFIGLFHMPRDRASQGRLSWDNCGAYSTDDRFDLIFRPTAYRQYSYPQSRYAN